MRRIIGGLRYDTETATEVAIHDNQRSRSDFHWLRETLFRSPRGNWFLYGQGGAATAYCHDNGHLRDEGETLRPLTPDEAFGWLQSHSGNPDAEAAILAHFADRVQDA